MMGPEAKPDPWARTRPPSCTTLGTSSTPNESSPCAQSSPLSSLGICLVAVKPKSRPIDTALAPMSEGRGRPRTGAIHQCVRAAGHEGPRATAPRIVCNRSQLANVDGEQEKQCDFCRGLQFVTASKHAVRYSATLHQAGRGLPDWISVPMLKHSTSVSNEHYDT